MGVCADLLLGSALSTQALISPVLEARISRVASSWLLGDPPARCLGGDLSDLGAGYAAGLAQLPVRGDGHGGVGRGDVHLQRLAGTNYGFVNRKPVTAPARRAGAVAVYLFTAAALLLTVWALMTWPWEHATIGAARSRRGGSSVG